MCCVLVATLVGICICDPVYVANYLLYILLDYTGSKYLCDQVYVANYCVYHQLII
jgi:hypothetical protein